MTIEEFADANDFNKITKHEVKNKIVYRLENSKDENACVGLPTFAIEIKDGFRFATPAETMNIMSVLYSDD